MHSVCMQKDHLKNYDVRLENSLQFMKGMEALPKGIYHSY